MVTVKTFWCQSAFLKAKAAAKETTAKVTIAEIVTDWKERQPLAKLAAAAAEPEEDMPLPSTTAWKPRARNVRAREMECC